MTTPRKNKIWMFLALLFVVGAARVDAAQRPPGAVIASAHALATDAGFEVLAAGGNAFDAAIAVASALAVVEQSSSGLGGGGFFLLYFGDGRDPVFVDAREVAPAAVNPADYLAADGSLDRDKSVNGPLAAGIPGEPAALQYLADKHGQLPLARSLKPAIRIARRGFPVYDKMAHLLAPQAEIVKRYPASAALYLCAGKPLAVGAILKQPDLAWTLQQMAEHGAVAFYRGEIAQRLLAGVRSAGGNWRAADLAGYSVHVRVPLRFRYQDMDIVTAPPPSSGGVALATMLNILSGYDLHRFDEATRTHVIVEAMRRAYRDRTLYLGDPDFVSVPVERLTHPHYADGLRASIRLDRATPSSALPGIESQMDGTDTTHFSIIDSAGNAVSATLSVNLPFGSGFTAPGTGVLLNNEMDDFALKAGAPNAYGLTGNQANAPAPGKRMLSSMTPTLMAGEDRLIVLGTPGGSRIITMVLLGILGFMDGQLPQTVVDLPRFHHQYLPDAISAEAGAFSPALSRALTALGHTVSAGEPAWGNMHAVLWDKRDNRLYAGADHRGGAGKGRVDINE